VGGRGGKVNFVGMCSLILSKMESAGHDVVMMPEDGCLGHPGKVGLPELNRGVVKQTPYSALTQALPRAG
jgi:hypothetical protein